MGFFSKPSPPPVRDATQVANQQTGMNTELTNRLFNLTAADQDSDYGSLNYEQQADGSYIARQRLSPEQRQLLDFLQGTKADAGQAAGGLLSATDYATPPSFGDMSSGLIGQQMSAYDAYQQPYFDRQRGALDARMRNQGLVPGGKSYDYQNMELEDNQFRQRNMALAQFEPEAFKQAMTQYEEPFKMAKSLADFGSPDSVIQNLWGTPQAQGFQTDLIGANADMNRANMERYRQEMENRAATMRTIGQIGGAALLGPMGGPMMAGLGGFGSALGGSMMSGLFGSGSMGASV